MKKVFLFTMAVIVSAFVISSCKKDKETTAQKLQHNWITLNYVDNSHDASGDNIDTTDATYPTVQVHIAKE